MIADSSTGILDNVVREFFNAMQGDYSKLEAFAKTLFYYLAAIQIVVAGMWLTFKGDPFEALVKVIQIFFTMSVFYGLLLFGSHWMPQIINGFISAGSDASGISSLTPSSVMDQGVSIGFSILDGFSRWGWATNPFGAFLAVIILLLIIILYALLAADMAIVLIKSYLMTSISGVMFAFGANEALRPISMNYFKAIIGLGLQLMVFYLLMGVGMSIGQDWADLIHTAAANHDLKPFLIVMAGVIGFYKIMNSIPPFVAGLSGMGGFKSYGSETVMGAMTVATTAVSAAATMGKSTIATAQGLGQFGKGAVQTGMAVRQNMNNGMSFGRSMANAAGHAAGSFSGAVSDSVMRHHQEMTFGQKFNSRMQERMAKEAATTKPATPNDKFKPNEVK